jgi:hypothetical protein
VCSTDSDSIDFPLTGCEAGFVIRSVSSMPLIVSARNHNRKDNEEEKIVNWKENPAIVFVSCKNAKFEIVQNYELVKPSRISGHQL